MLRIEWISCPEKLKQTLVFTSATSPDLMSDQDLYAVFEIAEMFHFESKLPSTWNQFSAYILPFKSPQCGLFCIPLKFYWILIFQIIIPWLPVG